MAQIRLYQGFWSRLFYKPQFVEVPEAPDYSKMSIKELCQEHRKFHDTDEEISKVVMGGVM